MKALVGEGAEVTVFLMANSVACAKAGHELPRGDYNLDELAEHTRAAERVLVF